MALFERRRQARVNADLVAEAERQRGLAECALDAPPAAHAALAERGDQLAGAPLRG